MKVPYFDLSRSHQKFVVQAQEAFSSILKSGAYILGPALKELEAEFAAYIGTKYALGVGSGTDALTFALRALDIKKGDEVILPSFTFTATALAVLHVGATPVFADVEENTFNLDPESARQAFSPKTRALIPVHLFGQCANMTELMALAKLRRLKVVEDACQASGALYKSSDGKTKMAGSMGDTGCFSFYPTKNIGALGDGGAIATGDEILASACRKIRDYGQSSKYQHELYGLNSRLDELQAAFLRLKLARLDAENKVRTELARYYQQQLSSLPDVTIVTPAANNLSNHHLFVIRTKNRDQLQQYLISQGITTAIHFPVLIPQQPFLKHLNTGSLPNASSFISEILSLPLHPYLSLTAIDYICSSIQRFFAS